MITQLNAKIQKTKHKIAAFTGAIEENISEVFSQYSISSYLFSRSYYIMSH